MPGTKKLICFCLILFWQNCLLAQQKIPYTVPRQMNDGIQTAHLKEAGINEALINSMTDSIVKGAYPNLHSLLILKNDQLVYENYFPGNDVVLGKGSVGIVDHHRDSLHDLRSATKSVISACIMIAIGQGKIKSVDMPVFAFFPEYARQDSGLKKSLTIHHLLTMTSGLTWNEALPWTDTANSLVNMNKAADPIAYFLSLPMTSPPGTIFNYSGGCTHMLGMILQKATGITVDEFAKTYLFFPLGIQLYDWNRLPTGKLNIGSGLRLRSRDMAKFGMLYLNKGKFDGQQIIGAALVEASLKAQVKTTTGAYGYQFWIGNYKIKEQALAIPECNGNGGQVILIVKKLNMVMVATGGNYDIRTAYKSPDFLFEEMIVPAMLKNE